MRRLLFLALLCCPAHAGESVAPSVAEVSRRLVEVLNSPDDEKHYSGSSVSFEAKGASVPDVLRLIAASSGLNLVWDSDVEALKVSLAVKNIPWDQLLDLVVRQHELKVFVSGNVIELETSARFLRRLEQRKKEAALGDGSVSLAVIPVAFADAKGMEHLVRELLPAEEKPAGKK